MRVLRAMTKGKEVCLLFHFLHAHAKCMSVLQRNTVKICMSFNGTYFFINDLGQNSVSFMLMFNAYPHCVANFKSLHQILKNKLPIWLVGCFGFYGPLRQYFSLYRAVSQREGERGEKR